MKHSSLFLATALLVLPLCLSAAEPQSSHGQNAIHVDVRGTGEPVILIPGLACSAEVWDDTVKHLNAEGFQTHAVTLAGFGGTTPVHTDRYLETVREDLVAYMEEKHLVKPVVIGHSLGGTLALWLAAQSPDLVGKVISVDGLPFLAGVMNPAITPEGARTLAQTVKQSMLTGSDEDYRKHARETLSSMVTAPANVDRELQVHQSSNRATVAEAMAELLSTDLRPEVRNIKAPVLVLGSWIAYKDYGATHESTSALYRTQFPNAPGVQIVMSDTARHFIQLDAPDWFYKEVDSFVRK